MLRCIQNYLRKKNPNPIPKKGSKEYLELQQKLSERRGAKPAAVVAEESNEVVPKFFKATIGFSSIPSSVGLLCMLISDPNNSLYYSGLAFSGTWIGMYSVFYSAFSIGLEGFYYKDPAYFDIKNYLFTGKSRVFYSCLGIPVGFLCIHSSINASWIGFVPYFFWLLSNTIFIVRSANKDIMPQWLCNGHWSWMVSAQIITIILMYKLFSDDIKLSAATLNE